MSLLACARLQSCTRALLPGAGTSTADHQPWLLHPAPESEETLLSMDLIKLSTHCLQIISNNRWQQNKDCWELVLSLSSNKITRPTNSLFHSMQELLQQREMHCTNTNLHRKQTYPFRFQVFSRVIFLVCFLHFPAPSA